MECKHFTSQRAADLEMRWEGKGQEKVWCGAEGSLGKRLLSGPIKPRLTAAPPRGSLVMESLPGQKLTPIRGCAGRGFTPTSPRRSRVSSRYGDGPGSSWEQRVHNEGCPGNPSFKDTARPGPAAPPPPPPSQPWTARTQPFAPFNPPTFARP